MHLFRIVFRTMFRFVFMFQKTSKRTRDGGRLYLPSTSIGVSSDIGTLEMKASSFFFTSAILPLGLILSWKVVADFSKEIFRPGAALSLV